MPIRPDKGKLLFSERNVDLTAGLKWDAAYDLALFEELGNPRRGVLVVTVICSFKFKDGTSTKGPSPGSQLTWTVGEKLAYMAGFKSGVERVWSEKHRITTLGTAPPVTDVGVLFEVHGGEDLSVFRHSHWNLHITKVDSGVTSNVEDGGGLITNGDANLDSQDLTPGGQGRPGADGPGHPRVRAHDRLPGRIRRQGGRRGGQPAPHGGPGQHHEPEHHRPRAPLRAAGRLAHPAEAIRGEVG